MLQVRPRAHHPLTASKPVGRRSQTLKEELGARISLGAGEILGEKSEGQRPARAVCAAEKKLTTLGWSVLAEFGRVKVRMSLGARERVQGSSFLGRTLPKETAWQGTMISGGDSNRKDTQKSRVVVSTQKADL